MAKLTRKDLKTDKFAEEVFDIWDWATENRDQVIRYGAIVLGIAVLILAGWGFSRYRTNARQDALAAASRINDASVGADNVPGTMHFDTQAQKDQARNKAYAEVASKYSGTDEGAIASMSLASDAAAKGNMAEAEKRYKEVVDGGPKNYAALARLSLAQIYESQNKNADAQKLLQEVVDHPTETVSKEQATIALARVVAKTNPQEALKLLDKLRGDPRTAISGAATQAYLDVKATGK